MKISDFAAHVCRREGKKKQVNIAQVKEIMKIINEELEGELYNAIRGIVWD